MKNDYNKTILTGNLTADPEIRYTAKGKPACNFTIGSNRVHVDSNGNTKEVTIFMEVTTWNHLAESVHKFKVKGDPVLVEGHLEMDQWEDKATGQKRTKIKLVAREVIFLPGGKGADRKQPDDPKPPRATAAGGPVSDRDDREMPEGDDIPF